MRKCYLYRVFFREGQGTWSLGHGEDEKMRKFTRQLQP